MCLAASAAAARLSVAAVVSGMSLSTPESKAMTGMPASFACCSSGPAAWLSSAAKPTASGLLSRAVCSIWICWSTSASVSGALEGDLDVELLGRLLGARLHGLPELVLEALRDERDVRRRRRLRGVGGTAAVARAAREHE